MNKPTAPAPRHPGQHVRKDASRKTDPNRK